MVSFPQVSHLLLLLLLLVVVVVVVLLFPISLNTISSSKICL